MKKKTQELIKRLDTHYGLKEWSRWREPVGELVRTILSQNTTDKNSLKAYADLQEAYPTWDDLLLADEKDLADVIRSGGLANTKAKKIKKALVEIKKQHGTIDLEFLADYELSKATDYLISLDGVGSKTAACVLIFSFNFPIIPADTHVHRLSNRIGVVDGSTREKTQELLQDEIPDKDKYSFHLNLIEHGRRICKAKNPICSNCFLQDICDYYQEILSKES
ncbi:MAG: endonuclease III domain-containing protein [Candidatus Heimdallarchaeota archaeon]